MLNPGRYVLREAILTRADRWSRRAAGCALTVFAAVALRPGGVSAQGAAAPPYDADDGLYAASELGLGGRPLYLKLFPSGWPTTREYRRMALEEGEAGFNDGIGAYLGSGLGVPVGVSTLARDRFAKRQKEDGGRAPVTLDAAQTDRFEQMRAVSGLAGPVPQSFAPPCLPFRRGTPSFKDKFDETKPWTWTWEPKGTDQQITLDGIGFAIYAEALYAEQQLSSDRSVVVGGSSQTLTGRTDVDGFLALVGLDCAVCGAAELRQKLCLEDLGNNSLSLATFPKEYSTEGPKAHSTYYPHSFTPTIGKGTVSYAVGAGPGSKSRLYDQAALLLGVSELAKASTPKSTGPGRFFSQDRKSGFFDPDTTNQVTELAIFVLESLKTLHFHPPSQKYASFADRDGAKDTIRAEDAGLLLVALECFLGINDSKNNKLLAAQKDAAHITLIVSNFMIGVQSTSKPPNTGFCDVYNVGESAAEFKNGDEKRSLAGQGLMIRGLLAAKRAFDLPILRAQSHRDALQAAQRAAQWIEDKNWDRERRAYLEIPGMGQKLTSRDAFAVLGALRDLALETGDVRYLTRYKLYLSYLRQRSLVLSETLRGRAGLDGVKSAADAGVAPVVVAEVQTP
jgi:hypothetical protein